MTHLTFIQDCLIPYWYIYVLSLFFVILIYIPIFKNFANSIIDPAFYALITAVFANTVPLFLFFIKRIPLELFIYFVCCEFIFWISYFIFRTQAKENKLYIYNDTHLSNSLYVILFLLLIICQLLTYIISGIPIFNEDRLNTYSKGNGIGILSYIINFSTIYCIIYSFYLIGKKTKRIICVFILTVIAIFALLTGSKSSILIIAFGYYFYKYYYRREKINLKKFKRFIPLFIIFPIMILMIQRNLGLTDAIAGVWNRFIANGDGYWQAYPENTLDNINIKHPWVYLFSRILAPFRIISYDQIETVIGIQLNSIVNADINIIGGSNTRLPVLSWILFGWKGLILSSILGTITALWKTRLPSILPSGILSVIFYAYIYISLISVITDPLLSSGKVFDITIGIVIYLIAVIMLRHGKIRLKINRINNTSTQC